MTDRPNLQRNDLLGDSDEFGQEVNSARGLTVQWNDMHVNGPDKENQLSELHYTAGSFSRGMSSAVTAAILEQEMPGAREEIPKSNLE